MELTVFGANVGVCMCVCVYTNPSHDLLNDIKTRNPELDTRTPRP